MCSNLHKQFFLLSAIKNTCTSWLEKRVYCRFVWLQVAKAFNQSIKDHFQLRKRLENEIAANSITNCSSSMSKFLKRFVVAAKMQKCLVFSFCGCCGNKSSLFWKRNICFDPRKLQKMSGILNKMWVLTVELFSFFRWSWRQTYEKNIVNKIKNDCRMWQPPIINK
jgi:hypothetical protein